MATLDHPPSVLGRKRASKAVIAVMLKPEKSFFDGNLEGVGRENLGEFRRGKTKNAQFRSTKWPISKSEEQFQVDKICHTGV